jgi:hypothetical protein
MTKRHKVFVSFHHDNDQAYKDKFEKLFADVYDIFVRRSVSMGDIDENLPTDTIRQKIRDEYLRDSTVTVVLIGAQTWQRKHVDWEIGSSLRHTEYNPRSGLLGILLPTYPLYNQNKYHPSTIPPRLADNLSDKPKPFASIHIWTENPASVQSWIHEAFLRKDTILPNNARPLFGRNWTSDRWTD